MGAGRHRMSRFFPACLGALGILVAAPADAATLTRADLSRWIESWIASLIPEGAGRVSVSGLTVPGEIAVPDGPVELRARPPQDQALIGRIALPVEVWVSGQRVRVLNVTFDADLARQVPVLTSRVAPGQEIRPADVAVVERPLSSLGRDSVLDAGELVGRVARRPLGPGQTVARTDLEAVVDRRRGDPVRVRVRSTGLVISATGTLIHDARLGDTVRVVCDSTRRELRGVLVDRSTVEVASR